MSETNCNDDQQQCFVSVRVKALRSELSLSQTQLAKKARLTSAAISMIEKGERDIAISTAKKLADALGVSIDYLAGRTTYIETEKHLRVEIFKLKQRISEISEIAKTH